MQADSAVQTVPACPICSTSKQELFFPSFYAFEDAAYDLVKCSGCQLIRVNPMPSNETIDKMYGDRYFHSDFISGRYEGDYEEIFKKRFTEMSGILSRLEKYIPHEQRTLFEIGPAGGMFLKCAKDRGWQVGGLEISSWGVEYAKKEYGLCVQHGDWLLTPLAPNRSPLIFLGDVFEHFTDPVLAIEKIKQALPASGYVVMMLPLYISSWTFRLFMKLSSVLKRLPLPPSFKTLLKVGDKIPPYHIYEYSAKTISAFLNKHGFKILLIKGDLPIPESLSAAKKGETKMGEWLRNLFLTIYQGIKLSSENFNFPLVRALVIAQKVGEI